MPQNDVCSICGSSQFKNYRGRTNVRCCKCFSLERHRDAWGVLRKIELGRVLYVGPEPCLAKRIRAACKSFVSMDLSPRYSATLKMNLVSTDFGDDEFDQVVCLHVLEHIVEAEVAIRELARIAKTAVISVPLIDCKSYRDETATTPTARTRSHGQHNHEWQFGSVDFETILLRNGFSECIRHKDTFLCR